MTMVRGTHSHHQTTKNINILKHKTMNNTFKPLRSTAAAAVIFISFFMPWINASFISVSGWDLATTAISPGMLGTYVSGLTRILLVLLLLIPVSSAFVIWQQYKPSKQYAPYMKRAHYAPAVTLIAALVIFGIKYYSATNVDIPAGYENLSQFGIKMPKIETPGLTDILGLGVWLGIASSIVLFAIGVGKVQDKNLFSDVPSATVTNTNTEQNQTISH